MISQRVQSERTVLDELLLFDLDAEIRAVDRMSSLDDTNPLGWIDVSEHKPQRHKSSRDLDQLLSTSLVGDDLPHQHQGQAAVDTAQIFAGQRDFKIPQIASQKLTQCGFKGCLHIFDTSVDDTVSVTEHFCAVHNLDLQSRQKTCCPFPGCTRSYVPSPHIKITLGQHLSGKRHLKLWYWQCHRCGNMYDSQRGIDEHIEANQCVGRDDQ